MNDFEANSLHIPEALPAATIMLIRDKPAGMEVLLLRKAAGTHFAGGAMVFPGGKMESYDEEWAMRLGIETQPFAALKLAAIREMYEECHILLCNNEKTQCPLSEDKLKTLLGDEFRQNFFKAMRRHSLYPAINQLKRFAHWVTPPMRSKRYDTHFFVARAPAGQWKLIVDGFEIVEGNWRRPKDILEDVYLGRLKLILPTMMNLMKLGQSKTVDSVLARAERENVICIQPKREETEDGPRIIIPEEAGYGVTHIQPNFLRPS